MVDLGNKELIISCDSSGAIGNKEMDVVKVSPDIVGYYGAHVALCENIAYGATPITIVNTLSVEMNNTGKEIIKGIRRAIDLINIDVIITGSTEENFPTIQTGIGITVIGIKEKNINFKTEKGDIAVLIGLPKLGEEVLNSKEILRLDILKTLRNSNYLNEIVPVGSKGIFHEINEISKIWNLEFNLFNNNIDLYKSAGPATCAIITLKEENLKNINIDIPINILGKFN
ncbi:AIR synthase related protein [Marinitoga litoralis]|uniref:AIR synthase related protein n=1 Tax=Marinitoga litoralis TaxID=570855 RepID=UPI003084070D